MSTQSERSRKWYLAHREEALRRCKIYRLNNPDKRKETSRKDNLKRKTKKRIWKENKFFNGNASLIPRSTVCLICSSNSKLIIHHKDGNNGRHGKQLNNLQQNLVVLCRSCHAKIHTRWWIKNVEEYACN